VSATQRGGGIDPVAPSARLTSARTRRARYDPRVRITARICVATTRSSTRACRAGRPALVRYAHARVMPSTRQMTAILRPVTAWPRCSSAVFFTSFRAAWRISISITFFPSAHSGFRMRCCAVRSSLAGTTGSFAVTAAVLPSLLSRCHCRTNCGAPTSSRANSATVTSAGSADGLLPLELRGKRSDDHLPCADALPSEHPPLRSKPTLPKEPRRIGVQSNLG
jgi:hypothetical protein